MKRVARKKKETYETFCSRLRPILPPGDLLDVELAYVLSKHAHRAQTRMELDPETGRPLRYFEHPRRVALILIDEVGCVDPVLLMAALVHDGVEDTRLITPDRIERHLGPDVARIVTMLSKVPKEGYLERLERFADWRALLIKACDRLDNLRSLGGATPEFVRKQVDETKAHYLTLFDRMVEQTPPELRKGARRIRREIDSLLRRHEAFLKKGRPAPPKARRARKAATR